MLDINAEGKKGLVSTTPFKVSVCSEKVSLLDRIVNYFTGFLDKEKNDAMLDFIRTGSIQYMNTTDGKKTEPSKQRGNLIDERLFIFKELISGNTKATLEQQREAIKGLNQFLKENDVRGEPRKKVSDYIKGNNIEHDTLNEKLQKLVAVESSDSGSDSGLFFEIDLNS